MPVHNSRSRKGHSLGKWRLGRAQSKEKRNTVGEACQTVTELALVSQETIDLREFIVHEITKCVISIREKIINMSVINKI